jgi:hypothetical protein
MHSPGHSLIKIDRVENSLSQAGYQAATIDNNTDNIMSHEY